MNAKYDADKHHRRSIRLQGYDYAQSGAYFVTLCIQERACLFGDVVDGIMQLSPAGQMVAECWQWLAQQYAYVELDEWVVMPNHLHGIVVIAGDAGDSQEGGSRTAPTQTAVKHKPLGRLIGAFKTLSTKRVNNLRDTPGAVLWQRNYYEHLIRSEKESDHSRQYITDNPLAWSTDQENPTRQL